MNCRGLSDLNKRRDVLNFLRKQNYDIFFLQDTHITKETIQYFNSLWKGKCYHSCHTNRRRGVSILIKHSVQYELLKVKHSDCGNFIMIVCKIGTRTYLFVNVYGPNDDDPNFYRKLTEMIDTFQTDYMIIGGDFNFVVDPHVDSLHYAREYNMNAKKVFLKFTNESELIDIWREKNPNKLEFTWSRNRPLKCGRLDMIFTSVELIPYIREVAIKPGYRTDHSLVTMTIRLTEIEKGPGIWKMNDSVLGDPEYTKLVETTIKETVIQYALPVYNEEYATDEKNYDSIQFTIKDSLFYETLLMLIRGETVKYCKRKARNRRVQEDELVDKIQLAQNIFNQDKCEANAQSLHKAKEDLEEHRKPYVEGLIVRSRTQWHEEGERSSKYFLSLEKRNVARKTVQYIENEGQIIAQPKAVLSLFTQALQSKYSSKEEVEPNKIFIRRNLSERLTEDEKTALDAELTLEDFSAALQSMKKGKTPGSNGFSVDFFRSFWKQLGIFLYRAFKLSYTEGTILGTHRESLITLIPKTGRQATL